MNFFELYLAIVLAMLTVNGITLCISHWYVNNVFFGDDNA